MHVYWHQRRACVESTKFTVHMNCTSSADNCRISFILGTWLVLTSKNRAYPLTVQLSVGLCFLLNRCFRHVSIFVTWTDEVYDIRNVTGRAENVTEDTDWVRKQSIWILRNLSWQYKHSGEGFDIHRDATKEPLCIQVLYKYRMDTLYAYFCTTATEKQNNC